MKIQLANSIHDQTQLKTVDLAIHAHSKKSNKASALSKRQKEKKAGSVITALVKKMTRPLNSWIAFRSYYAVIFITMPQKVISVFLAHLWRADPTKAKWTILAKAYSELREKVGKMRAPLPAFLAVNAPFVGLVHPNDYLRIHGWDLIDRDGQTILRRAARPDGGAYEISMLMTNASVEDVIRNSCYHGYIKEDNLPFSSSGGTSLIMATSAQPVSVAHHSFDRFLPPVRSDTGWDNTTASTAHDEAGGYMARLGPGGPSFGSTHAIINASEASSLSPSGGPTSVWETALPMNTRLNGFTGAGLMGVPKYSSGEAQLLHQAGSGLLAGELEARLRAAHFDLNDDDNGIGNPTFQPDVDNLFFDPFNHAHQFDAYHLSHLNHSNAADLTNGDAF